MNYNKLYNDIIKDSSNLFITLQIGNCYIPIGPASEKMFIKAISEAKSTPHAHGNSGPTVRVDSVSCYDNTCYLYLDVMSGRIGGWSYNFWQKRIIK